LILTAETLADNTMKTDPNKKPEAMTSGFLFGFVSRIFELDRRVQSRLKLDSGRNALESLDDLAIFEQ
jgi:hypothetical protein